MNYSVIVASGSGSRMKSAIRKQYLTLANKPILYHTLHAFNAHPEIDHIRLVIPKADKSFVAETVLSLIQNREKIQLVNGGKRRQDSVFNGLKTIDDPSGIVLIHDGVRPFIHPNHIKETISGAQKLGASILAIPATDTLKSISSDDRISHTLNRNKIWMAQTPQAFRVNLIQKAYKEAEKRNIQATDDASILEAMGVPVHMTLGSRFNIKITTPEDLVFANAIIAHQSAPL